MPHIVPAIADWSAAIVELIGLVILIAFALYALAFAAYQAVRRAMPPATIYQETRRRLAQGILLGLEFLVAADIIHTIAVDLTPESVATLAAIVLIRTFLSFSLEVELNGHWPWQRHTTTRDPTGDGQ